MQIERLALKLEQLAGGFGAGGTVQFDPAAAYAVKIDADWKSVMSMIGHGKWPDAAWEKLAEVQRRINKLMANKEKLTKKPTANKNNTQPQTNV